MKEFFVLVREFQHHFEPKAATVYVKGGTYFREQGGLSEEWGKSWRRIEAHDAADALIKAHESVGTKCPQFKIDYYRAADRALAEGRDPQAAADGASMRGFK